MPLIVEPYAVDLARRVTLRQPSRVLEIAAGTGVVTREAALKRRRLGWVLLTLISFNPFLWLLQNLYTSRRWHEMSMRLAPRDSDAPRSNVAVGVTTEQAPAP